MLNKEVAKKICDAVDDFEKNPEKLKGIKNGSGYYTHSGRKFNGTYWENYFIVKSLNLGHHPTKAETDEANFYAVAKVMGNGDAEKGIKKFLSQFED